MKRVAFVLALVAFVGGLSIRAEAAIVVQCGTAIPDQPTDTVFKLKHNLTCQPAFDPAISLGDHVILDLGGHTLQGSGTGDGVKANAKDHSTVRNGTIKNFVAGVVFSNGNADTASRLTLANGSSDVDFNGTSKGVVSRSTMSGSGFACVSVVAADGTTIQSNRMTCNANAVNLSSSPTETLVQKNRISATAIGINVNTTGLANTRIVSNVIRGGSRGIDVLANAVNTSIIGNNVAGASLDGIRVLSGALTTAIGSNVTDSNTHDGILVQSSDAGTSVGGNTANNNGNYGIEATAGTDDAGGDRAKGNEQFLQCIFVLCT